MPQGFIAIILAFFVVWIASISLLRKGRITVGTQRTLVAIAGTIVAISLAVHYGLQIWASGRSAP